MPSNYPIVHFQWSSPTLPKHLWNIPEPPHQLYIQGSPKAFQLLEALPENGLAIVGTRQPHMKSLKFLNQIIESLANTSLIIISGLARGIDTAAHHAALEVHLKTIAILGAGLMIDYPKENKQLKEKILENDGLLVSEFSNHTSPQAFHFLKRNRIIAAWSKATWVVEAKQRSGALNTARWAREQDKLCFAVPSYPNDPTLLGNQTLLDRDHALPLWNTHSFGAAWLPLASVSLKKSEKISSPPLRQPLYKTFQELYDWALRENWSTDQFFNYLKEIRSKNHRSAQE